MAIVSASGRHRSGRWSCCLASSRSTWRRRCANRSPD